MDTRWTIVPDPRFAELQGALQERMMTVPNSIWRRTQGFPPVGSPLRVPEFAAEKNYRGRGRWSAPTPRVECIAPEYRTVRI